MAFLHFYFSFRPGTSSALFLLLLFVFNGFLESSKKSTGLEIERSQPLTPSPRPEGAAMATHVPRPLTRVHERAHSPGPERVWGEGEACKRLDNELSYFLNASM